MPENPLPISSEILPDGFHQYSSSGISNKNCSYARIKKGSFSFDHLNRGPIVISIQDIHANFEAQKNIVKILNDISSHKNIDFIALEGADGPIQLSRLKKFPRQDSVKILSDFLLKENKISGPIYWALNHKGNIPVIHGIDDPKRYQANIDAYLRSKKTIKEARTSLQFLSKNSQKNRSEILNPALLAFDAEVDQFYAGKLSLAQFALMLSRRLSDIPESTSRFLEAAELEKSLSFERVESERSVLLTKIVEKLNGTGRRKLFAMIFAVKSGEIDQVDFYQQLIELCNEKKLDTSPFPCLMAYVRYLQMVSGIDGEEIFSMIRSLEDAAYEKLIRTPAERNYCVEARWLRLAQKLINFELTPNEWVEYKAGKLASLYFFESFYRLAEERDRLIAQNLINKIDERKAEVVVLVAGGFHSNGVNAILEKQGISSIIVTPRLSRTDKRGSGYLTIFDRKKTPLERLLKGQRLTTALPPITPGEPELLLPVADHIIDSGIDPQFSLFQAWPQAAERLKATISESGESRGIEYTLHPVDEAVPPARYRVDCDRQNIDAILPLDPFPGFSFKGIGAWFERFFKELSQGISSAIRIRSDKLPAEVFTCAAGNIDDVARKLVSMGEWGKALKLRGVVSEIFQQEFYAPFKGIPFTYEIVRGLGRTAEIREGRIALELNLLEYPDLLLPDLREEIHQIISRFLWNQNGETSLSREESAVEEIYLDMQKIISFRALDPEKQAAYIGKLIREFDFKDGNGFHTVLICSLPQNHKAGIVNGMPPVDEATGNLSEPKGLKEEVISRLPEWIDSGDLENIKQFWKIVPYYDLLPSDPGYNHENFINGAFNSLFNFYRRSNPYPQYASYFNELPDQPQRARADYHAYEAKLNSYWNKFFHERDHNLQVESSEKPLYAVILAGGKNRRLFPLPDKTFLDIARVGATLLEIVFDLLTRVYLDRPYFEFIANDQISQNLFVVTSARPYADAIFSLLNKKGLPQKNILITPEDKNPLKGTVGALIWMMLKGWARDRRPDAIIPLFNADQIVDEDINGTMKWRKAHMTGLDVLKQAPKGEKRIVGIGFKCEPDDPTWPYFGIYGLKEGETLLHGKATRAVQFMEAASPDHGREMMGKNYAIRHSVGHYMATLETWEWVLLRVSSLPENQKYHIYDYYQEMKKAAEEGDWPLAGEYFKRLPEKIFIPERDKEVELSIAYALLEPLARKGLFASDEPDDAKVYVVDADYRIVDVGSWRQFHEKYGEKDRFGNSYNNADNLELNSEVRNTLFYAQSSQHYRVQPNRRIVVNTPLTDFMVVHVLSGDVLITKLSNMGDRLKQFVEKELSNGNDRKEIVVNSKNISITRSSDDKGVIVVWDVDNLVIHKKAEVLTISGAQPEDTQASHASLPGTTGSDTQVSQSNSLASMVENGSVNGGLNDALVVRNLSDFIGTPESWELNEVKIFNGMTVVDTIPDIVNEPDKKHVFVVDLNSTGDPKRLGKELSDLKLMAGALTFEEHEILIVVHGQDIEKQAIYDQLSLLSELHHRGIALVEAEGSAVDFISLFKKAPDLTASKILEAGGFDSLHIHLYSQHPEIYIFSQALSQILTMWSEMGDGYVMYGPGYLDQIPKLARTIQEKA